jgi:hypothetical protein
MNIASLPVIVLSALLIACGQPANGPGNASPEPTFNVSMETDSIISVIDQETKYFFDGNYERWTSMWSHEPYALQAWNNEDGSCNTAVGWEAINKQGKDWIEKYYANGENVIHPIVKREEPIVKFYNDSTAYLMWKQFNADKESKFYKVSHESRLMEKKSDGWKIVNVSAFWDATSHIPADSLQ